MLDAAALDELLDKLGAWHGGPPPGYEETVHQHDVLGLVRPPLVLVPLRDRPGGACPSCRRALDKSGPPATPHLITSQGRFTAACKSYSLRCRHCRLAIGSSFMVTKLGNSAVTRCDFAPDVLTHAHLRVSQRLVVELEYLRVCDKQIVHQDATYESLANALTDGAPASDALRKSEMNDGLQLSWLIEFAGLMRAHFEPDGHLSVTYEPGADFINVGILLQQTVLDEYGNFYFDMSDLEAGGRGARALLHAALPGLELGVRRQRKAHPCEMREG